MSKNIELQAEFEVLISELERLKSINEITSENSNNAKKTIEEIKSFVQSVNDFKKSISIDYNAKKEDLESIENSLRENLHVLSDNIGEQTKNFEDIVFNHSSEFNKSLESIENKLSNEINDYTTELGKTREKLNEDFNAFKNLTLTKVEEESLALNKLVLEFKSSMDTSFDGVKKLLDQNHEVVLEELNKINQGLDSTKKRVKNLTAFIITVVVVGVLTFCFLLYKYT